MDLTPDEPELEYQPHTVNDPEVWGLRDVARGRGTVVPTTIYKVAGDSASGVVGILMPGGIFIVKHSCRIGQSFEVGLLHDVKPSPREAIKTLETVWDGAAPADEFTDEDTGEVRQEHSKGLLLGNYAMVPKIGKKRLGVGLPSVQENKGNGPGQRMQRLRKSDFAKHRDAA